MPELSPEVTEEEVAAVMREQRNYAWRHPEYKLWQEQEQRQLSLPECYDREIKQARRIFERMREVANQEIPPGKHLLFVDMVEQGLVGRPEIKYIDQGRLAKMYEAETGSPNTQQDFQSANMRYCFGFEAGDRRFQTVKALHEPLPTNLDNCVGIILSGSEANIKDETEQRWRDMTKKVLAFTRQAKDQGIPMFGICFGSQLLNTIFRAKVDWIRETNSRERKAESGLVLLHKTAAGEQADSPLAELPIDFYVHANHKQEVLSDSMPPELETLASSATSNVQIVRLKDANVVWAIQNHIECGDTRANIADDLAGVEVIHEKMFQDESNKARQVLCPHFLRACGEFAQAA